MFIICIKLIMWATLTNITFTPMYKPLAVLSGYGLILASCLLPFTAIKTPMQLRVKPSIFYLIMLAVIMLFSYVLEPTSVDMDLIKGVLMFFCTYIAIAIEEQPFSKHDLKYIFNIGKILSMVYISYTFLPFPFRYTVVNEWGATGFTMGMGNTNATAISVMFCIFLLIGDTLYEDRLATRILDYILALALMYTVYLLESRTILICGFVLLLFPFFRKIRIRKWHVLGVVLIPIAFIALQLWLSEQESIVVLGKPLASGRHRLYTSYINSLQSNPLDYLFGKWGNHKLANYHNAPFAIFLNFGALGLVLYYMFWFTELKEMLKRRSALSTLAILGVLMFFIHSSAEAAPMLGFVIFGSEMVIVCRIAKNSIA